MELVTGAKPLGKAGRKRKKSGARGVKVYTELRLRDYAKLRKLAHASQRPLAAVVREFVLRGLDGEASADNEGMARGGAIEQ